MNIKKQSLKALKYLQDLDSDDVLDAVGLQQRNPWGTTFGVIGIFAFGALIGAGLGIAFAPKSGNDLRNQIGDTVRRKTSEFSQGEDSSRDYPSSSTGRSANIT